MQTRFLFFACWLVVASVGSTQSATFCASKTSQPTGHWRWPSASAYNGVSAALYNLIANAINSSEDTLYLLLNALVPLITSVAALPPLLRQPPIQSLPADAVSPGAIFLLVIPLGTPGIIYARDWARRTIHSSFRFEGSRFNLVDVDDLELHKELIGSGTSSADGTTFNGNNALGLREKRGCCVDLIEKDQLTVLGEEHPAKWVVRRRDFWLYYLAYFCGGTIGLVYSNNLGQISQSLGYSSQTSSIVTLYSACSFFGRLFSAAPDFLRDKVYFARTGWFMLALVPTPIAFLLLSLSGSKTALVAATAMIGLSSGFVFAAAVSITSELFGPNSAGVNHNILITNIPLGSILYGLVAALVYDANIDSSNQVVLMGESMVCMGRECYFDTFVLWGCMSLLGLASSFLLFLRTKHAYDHLERTRNQT
ncbi:hypothetical protein HYC85_016768 [Camellia sinensis]|uniref:Nodulin-like domain-containing protein n=1 Tax=Camellia sinensis TaxID=4442 RepID=A0A7J7H0Q1_CAMSI|nr:hypothetical protein HYC85_016768 [Camellia sinensis]